MTPPVINWFATQPSGLHARLAWGRQLALEALLGALMAGVVVLVVWGAFQEWARHQQQELQQQQVREQAQKARQLEQVKLQAQRQLNVLHDLQLAQQQGLQRASAQWLSQLPQGVTWQAFEWSDSPHQWRLLGKASSHRQAWQAFQQAQTHPVWGSGLRWEAAQANKASSAKRAAPALPSIDVVWRWSPHGLGSESAPNHGNKAQP